MHRVDVRSVGGSRNVDQRLGLRRDVIPAKISNRVCGNEITYQRVDDGNRPELEVVLSLLSNTPRSRVSFSVEIHRTPDAPMP
jgi:hypothetical protein